ncbi:MAG TPA: restriction endonuclease subunit S [Oscillatoriaceae cyanobacterium M33_DOE_052]|nr:restriction endonuclease subunit S [Oscillatoriaceae cyanobacterium M33_DOE_052]
MRSQGLAGNNNQVPPGYKQTEVGVIPEDWEVDYLGKYVDINSGESPSKFNFVSQGIPYFKVEQLNNDSKYLQKTPYHIQSGKTIKAGSIVFPKRGASILLNKVCILLKNSFIDTNLMALTVFEALDVEYLYYFINFFGLSQVADTTSIPQINNKHIIPLNITIPPLPEQKTIASVLSDVDELISSLDKLIAKKRHIKTATMQQLLTGKTRLPGFGEGMGYKKSAIGLIPEDWDLRMLGEDALTYSGGTPSTQNLHYYSGEISWITSGDLKKRYIFNVKGKISENGLKNSSAKMIFPNTLLLALYGATAGIPAISKIQAAINQAILAIIPRTFNCEYLFYYLEKNKNKIIETYTQGGQPNLSGKIINSLLFPYPKPQEQKAIASVLSDMDQEIAALEKRRAKTQAIKQGMMQELLTGKTRIIDN